MHQQDAVAETPGQRRLVQHHGYGGGAIARGAGKQFEHGDLVLEIEVGHRFVKQEQFRLLGQQGGDGQALALAA